MIWLLLSLSFGSCIDNLTSSDFTPEAVAQVVERLGERDGRIFGAVVNGYKYAKIAKHFGVTVEYVLEIKRKGLENLWLLRSSLEHSP